jgi:hypothetical protein
MFSGSRREDSTCNVISSPASFRITREFDGEPARVPVIVRS